MNPEGMNSLNHYSFGAIMEWAYSYLLGIKPAHPGYQEINFSPLFDYRLKQVNGHFDTPYGTFAVSYQIEADSEHTIKLNLTVPFWNDRTCRFTTRRKWSGNSQQSGKK